MALQCQKGSSRLPQRALMTMPGLIPLAYKFLCHWVLILSGERLMSVTTAFGLLSIFCPDIHHLRAMSHVLQAHVVLLKTTHCYPEPLTFLTCPVSRNSGIEALHHGLVSGHTLCLIMHIINE